MLQVCRCEVKLDGRGVTKLWCDPSSPVAYFACLDCRIRSINLLTGNVGIKLKGHKNIVLDISSDRFVENFIYVFISEMIK